MLMSDVMLELTSRKHAVNNLFKLTTPASSALNETQMTEGNL